MAYGAVLLCAARTVAGLSLKSPSMLADTSAGIWINIQSAGAASEVNLRITQRRKHAKGTTPSPFCEILLDCRKYQRRSPKYEYQWLHEKDLCPPKFFKKKKEHRKEFHLVGSMDVGTTVG